VRIQAAFQQYTDNAVSKTINFSNNATAADIAKVYTLAYELGCKGVTVFRDGSRAEQALLVGKSGSANDQSESTGESVLVDVALMPEAVEDARVLLAQAIEKRPRPRIISGKTYRKNTGYGKVYITINDDENGNAFEIFATIGKSGGLYAAKSEAICRLVSLALRSGIKSERVVRELKGIRGPMPIWDKGVQVLSLADAIGQTLEEHIKADQQQLNLQYEQRSALQEKPAPAETNSAPIELEATTVPQAEITFTSEKEEVIVAAIDHATVVQSIASHSSTTYEVGISSDCADCGSPLEFSEGCLLCRGCGYSKCG